MKRQHFHLKSSFEKKNPFILIGSVDSTVSAKYIQLNEQIERVSELLFVVLMKLTYVGAVLPHFLVSVGSHFVFDMGNELYILPSPVM